MSRPRFLATGALIALTMAALSPVAAEAPAIAALKGPSGIALIQLFDSPPELSDGAKARMVAVPSADIMAAKVISGEFAAAVLPVNMAAKLRNSGIPIVLGAVVGNGMVGFLTNDPSIRELGDLKGGELYVAGQGATPEYLMRKLLADVGLDPDRDLKLSFALPYPEMAAAVASGKIKSAVLPEPFITLAKMANPSLLSPLDLGVLWTKATGMADYPMTVLVFREDSPLTQADRRAILDAARVSIVKTLADPQGAGLLVEKYDLGLKAAVAAAAIPRCGFAYQESRAAHIPIVTLLREFLKSSPQSIGGKLPDEAFYAVF